MRGAAIVLRAKSPRDLKICDFSFSYVARWILLRLLSLTGSRSVIENPDVRGQYFLLHTYRACCSERSWILSVYLSRFRAIFHLLYAVTTAYHRSFFWKGGREGFDLDKYGYFLFYGPKVGVQ